MGWADERARLLSDEPVATLAIPDPCVILGCSEPIADGDVVYCSRHRVMADDGTLWLRCVNHPARPVAPNDPIACPECRALIGATVMPWEVPA